MENLVSQAIALAAYEGKKLTGYFDIETAVCRVADSEVLEQQGAGRRRFRSARPGSAPSFGLSSF